MNRSGITGASGTNRGHERSPFPPLAPVQKTPASRVQPYARTRMPPSRLFNLQVLGALSCVLLAAGCKGWSVSQCVSPQVKGRVLDDQTHQPVPDVQVQRVAARPRRTDDAPPKGGQLMEKAPRIVLTGADGTFDLDGEYSVAAFQVITWNSVDVQFRHAGYLSLTTNFTPSMASSGSNGVCVNAGDILLKRDSTVSSSESSP